MRDPVEDRGRDVRRSPAVRRLLREIEYRLEHAGQRAQRQTYEPWQAGEQRQPGEQRQAGERWQAYEDVPANPLVSRATFQSGVPRSRNP